MSTKLLLAAPRASEERVTRLLGLTVRHEHVAERRGVAAHELATLTPKCVCATNGRARHEPVALNATCTAWPVLAGDLDQYGATRAT